MVATDSAQRTILEKLSRLRRQAGESSLMAFSQAYLPAHFRLEPSAMHRQLFAMLESASGKRGKRRRI